METIIILKNYIGTGYLFFFYLAAIVYLLVTEKDKRFRALLIYAPMALLFIFLLPLTHKFYVLAGLDGETYYRFLWLLPLGVTIAYSGLKLFAGQTKALYHYIGLIAVCFVIILSGSYVYANPHISRAENLYNLPHVTMNVCDFILADAEFDHVIAVFPKEHVSYVRQYTSHIRLAYGRDMLVERWGFSNQIYDIMEKHEIIDIPTLLEYTRPNEVNYIVIHWSRATDANPENYGLILLDQVDGMLIYRDEVVAEQIRGTFGPYYPRFWQ